MTKRERIELLEKAVAALEARVIALEARPQMTWTYPLPDRQPVQLPYGGWGVPTITWGSTSSGSSEGRQ